MAKKTSVKRYLVEVDSEDAEKILSLSWWVSSSPDTDGRVLCFSARIGKDDTYYMTENDVPRKINKTGVDGSVGLGRYVKFFPTPQSRDYKSGQADRIERESKQKNLNDFVQMWPTPKAGINRNSRNAITGENRQGKHKSDMGLEQAVEVAQGILPRELETPEELPPRFQETWKSMFPTPQASDWKNKNCSRDYTLGNKKYLFPTPNSRDWKDSGPTQGNRDSPNLGTIAHRLTMLEENRAEIIGQLNADWVEALMGYPLFWTDIGKESNTDMRFPLAWLNGTWEEGIPRIITGQKNRGKRLRCIGNAVVPEIPMLLWLLIAGAL